MKQRSEEKKRSKKEGGRGKGSSVYLVYTSIHRQVDVLRQKGEGRERGKGDK